MTGLQKLMVRSCLVVLATGALPHAEAATAPVVTVTHVPVRVLAANLSSGNNQRYEGPGLRIIQALQPDIVAIQEFNYASAGAAGINTSNAFREMVSGHFGTNFVWFRESGYSIPNGVISRWPITASGSWEDVDTGVNDRGFAWARIDLPGPDDLYVVSMHLKAGSSDTVRRAAQAAQLKSLVQSNFPANAFVVVAGDCNIYDAGEAALATFKSYLSDSPIPADAGGDADTNAGRNERYDYVFPSASLNTNRVATVLGAQTFANGLVLDTRLFTPSNEMLPALPGDSGVTGMQHMGVVRDFRLSVRVTNWVTVPPPMLVLVKTNVVRWAGLSNLTYAVQTSSTFSNWTLAGTATSATTNFFYTNSQPATNWRFFRVLYP